MRTSQDTSQIDRTFNLSEPEQDNDEEEDDEFGFEE